LLAFTGIGHPAPIGAEASGRNPVSHEPPTGPRPEAVANHWSDIMNTSIDFPVADGNEVSTTPSPYQGDDHLEMVRADRKRLPSLLRPLHRILTAVPDAHAAIPQRSPVSVLARDLGLLTGFMAMSGLGASMMGTGSLASTALGALLAAGGGLGVVGRLRRLVVGHNHEAGHGVVVRWYMRERGWSKKRARRVSEAILDIATALSFTTNGHDYRQAHKRHHSLRMLGTLKDPDGAMLFKWGFWGNMRPGEFKRRLLCTVFSPRWHAEFLLERARSNLLRGKPYRRVMGLASLVALASMALVVPPPAWFAAILIPWTWGYQTASLLQVLTRHNYPHSTGARSLREYTARTWERIPWTPLPDRGLAGTAFLRAWSAWAAELMLVHVPSRLAVLDSSMIWHSFHHTAYLSGVPFDDWWNTGYRATAARRDRTMVADGAGEVICGLPEAFRRQAARMESRLR
jgi:hypothetical protein